MQKLPEIRVFAGPNGSGKSTFATDEWIIQPYINADDIQREQNITTMEAALQAEALREECLSQRKSFTFETVLSTERNMLLLERAKERGYFIKGYYFITHDPGINECRVASRVAAGGHDVPVDKIRERYRRSRLLVPRLFLVCDILHIYDNSYIKDGISLPFRIVRKHKYDWSIYPNEHWCESQIYELIGVDTQ